MTKSKHNIIVFLWGLAATLTYGGTFGVFSVEFDRWAYPEYGVDTKRALLSFAIGFGARAWEFFKKHWRLLLPESWSDEIDEGFALAAGDRVRVEAKTEVRVEKIEEK